MPKGPGSRLSLKPFLSMRYKAVGILSVLAIAAMCLAAASYAVPLAGKALSTFHVSTIAGSKPKGYVDGPGAEARFNWPTGVVAARDGTLYIADFSNNTIRRMTPDRITPERTVSTLAGSTRGGYLDATGADALLNGPDNIAIDSRGNIFVADANNYRIRRITPEGEVSTVAGNGRSGLVDGTALRASFGYPTGIAVDSEDNLFVADRRTHAIRKITFSKDTASKEGALVSTVAGNGYPGFADGSGIASHLREPISVAVGPDGAVYFSDSGNNAIRKITPDGAVKTIAGGIKRGFRDGIGPAAVFSWPTGIIVDNYGNIYVCDSGNNAIRRVTMGGVVSTVAGSLRKGALNGPGFRSSFNFPTGIAIDIFGNIFVADSGNNMIRKITVGEPL